MGRLLGNVGSGHRHAHFRKHEWHNCMVLLWAMVCAGAAVAAAGLAGAEQPDTAHHRSE